MSCEAPKTNENCKYSDGKLQFALIIETCLLISHTCLIEKTITQKLLEYKNEATTCKLSKYWRCRTCERQLENLMHTRENYYSVLPTMYSTVESL